MTMLRSAADTASRTALEYYDIVTNNAGNIMPQFTMNGIDYRGSVAPHRAITEEPEDGKRRRKRNVKPKDPNAPKKPATPFLLFCQTGRETVKTDLGPEATYAEVQEELKRRWENEADKAVSTLECTWMAVLDIPDLRIGMEPRLPEASW